MTTYLNLDAEQASFNAGRKAIEENQKQLSSKKSSSSGSSSSSKSKSKITDAQIKQAIDTAKEVGNVAELQPGESVRDLRLRQAVANIITSDTNSTTQSSSNDSYNIYVAGSESPTGPVPMEIRTGTVAYPKAGGGYQDIYVVNGVIYPGEVGKAKLEEYETQQTQAAYNEAIKPISDYTQKLVEATYAAKKAERKPSSTSKFTEIEQSLKITKGYEVSAKEELVNVGNLIVGNNKPSKSEATIKVNNAAIADALKGVKIDTVSINQQQPTVIPSQVATYDYVDYGTISWNEIIDAYQPITITPSQVPITVSQPKKVYNAITWGEISRTPTAKQMGLELPTGAMEDIVIIDNTPTTKLNIDKGFVNVPSVPISVVPSYAKETIIPNVDLGDVSWNDIMKTPLYYQPKQNTTSIELSPVSLDIDKGFVSPKYSDISIVPDITKTMPAEKPGTLPIDQFLVPKSSTKITQVPEFAKGYSVTAPNPFLENINIDKGFVSPKYSDISILPDIAKSMPVEKPGTLPIDQLLVPKSSTKITQAPEFLKGYSVTAPNPFLENINEISFELPAMSREQQKITMRPIDAQDLIFAATEESGKNKTTLNNITSNNALMWAPKVIYGVGKAAYDIGGESFEFGRNMRRVVTTPEGRLGLVMGVSDSIVGLGETLFHPAKSAKSLAVGAIDNPEKVGKFLFEAELFGVRKAIMNPKLALEGAANDLKAVRRFPSILKNAAKAAELDMRISEEIIPEFSLGVRTAGDLNEALGNTEGLSIKARGTEVKRFLGKQETLVKPKSATQVSELRLFKDKIVDIPIGGEEPDFYTLTGVRKTKRSLVTGLDEQVAKVNPNAKSLEPYVKTLSGKKSGVEEFSVRISKKQLKDLLKAEGTGTIDVEMGKIIQQAKQNQEFIRLVEKKSMPVAAELPEGFQYGSNVGAIGRIEGHKFMPEEPVMKRSNRKRTGTNRIETDYNPNYSDAIFGEGMGQKQLEAPRLGLTGRKSQQLYVNGKPNTGLYIFSDVDVSLKPVYKKDLRALRTASLFDSLTVEQKSLNDLALERKRQDNILQKKRERSADIVRIMKQRPVKADLKIAKLSNRVYNKDALSNYDTLLKYKIDADRSLRKAERADILNEKVRREKELRAFDNEMKPVKPDLTVYRPIINELKRNKRDILDINEKIIDKNNALEQKENAKISANIKRILKNRSYDKKQNGAYISPETRKYYAMTNKGLIGTIDEINLVKKVFDRKVRRGRIKVQLNDIAVESPKAEVTTKGISDITKNLDKAYSGNKMPDLGSLGKMPNLGKSGMPDLSGPRRKQMPSRIPSLESLYDREEIIKTEEKENEKSEDTFFSKRDESKPFSGYRTNRPFTKETPKTKSKSSRKSYSGTTRGVYDMQPEYIKPTVKVNTGVESISIQKQRSGSSTRLGVFGVSIGKQKSKQSTKTYQTTKPVSIQRQVQQQELKPVQAQRFKSVQVQKFAQAQVQKSAQVQKQLQRQVLGQEQIQRLEQKLTQKQRYRQTEVSKYHTRMLLIGDANKTRKKQASKRPGMLEGLRSNNIWSARKILFGGK